MQVTYDLQCAQPLQGDNRNILIWRMLAPFGAQLFDVKPFKGDRETGKGWMHVRCVRLCMQRSVYAHDVQQAAIGLWQLVL